MPKILPLCSNPILENAAYSRVRQNEAQIVKRQRHLDGELFKVMNSTHFDIIASRMTEHFFHRSRNLAIYNDMTLMNKAILALAPVVQGLPNSMHFDMHQGHVMSFFRVGTNRRAGKYYFSAVQLANDQDHMQLVENLHRLKVFDEKFINVIVELFRNYYGRPTATGKLAGSLFDPLMFHRCTEDNSIRVANVIYRLRKQPFEGCIDLRKQSGRVLTYQIKKIEGREQGYLEINIDKFHIGLFEHRIERIMRSSLPPKFKMELIERQMNRFMGGARYARSGFMQVVELSRWLRDKIAPLRPEVEEAGYFHKIFVNRFKMGLDIRRYPYKLPNFFYDPTKHDQLTFIRFFSPFREEGLRHGNQTSQRYES